ncbi:cation diffusion facilitator family transporter [Nocardia transvalensis]|uniref:cation diffusion facilitator family transporter n=1 Tax=Nocardia transvalensis TaxID=37333 RepID=UPI001894DAFD|nr:cation diffusion facilitator family transporter [Nocardia transvalensis]MBF6334168.1 cation transporter [Nocardia transvalensis]
MGHDHGHAAAPESASGRYLNRLVLALCIGVAYLLTEVGVAAATGSLALLSDAAHMLTDVVGLSMALSAVLLAKRTRPTYARTFGYYRAEVLAALANALLLFAVAAYVLYEAIRRLGEPPVVPGLPVLIVGAIGLVANTTAFLLLRSGARESLNLRGAYLEVLSDLVGSLGVLVSAVITLLAHWPYADPIVGVAIGLWVLPRTWVLARRSLRILFQHSPEDLDVEQIAAALQAVPGVSDVHDLHVWTLTSGMEVASAHLATEAGGDGDDVLRSAQRILRDGFRIEHATLQIESPDSARHCGELSW